MIPFFQLIGGLVLLVYAGDALIRGSVSMARRLNISPMIIGLTVVAFGTSAPELMVGIDAVVTGVPTLALGNVVGSNIANVWLVVGLPAVIAPMICKERRFNHNMIGMILATLVFIGFAYTHEFTAFKGGLLLIGLLIFLFLSSRKDKKEPVYKDVLKEMEGLPAKPDSFRMGALIIVSSLIGLMFGAHFFVQGAVEFAIILGVPDAIIGLTLVAIGTSIPELVTAIAASIRGHCDVAMGNVLGSNIFNLFGIIGISSLFGDIPVPDGFLKFDLWVMLAAAMTFIPFAFMKKSVGRHSGIFFLLAYSLYIIFLAKGASGVDYTVMMNGIGY